MSRSEEAHRKWWNELPTFPITLFQAMRLYEYSATDPTGVTVGKTWRRHDGSFDHIFIRQGGTPRWVICRYEEAPDEMRRVRKEGTLNEYAMVPVKMCKRAMYRPVIRVRATSVRVDNQGSMLQHA
jgi:hypothetical protein